MHRHVWVESTWARVAQQLGLKFKTGGLKGAPKLHGRLNGFSVGVETRRTKARRWRDSDEDDRKTHYELTLPDLGLDLQIRRAVRVVGGKAIRYEGTIETCDREFDNQYAVTGNDAARLDAFFDDERIAAVRAFCDKRRGAKVTPKRIYFTSRTLDVGYTMTETLKALTALASALVERPIAPTPPTTSAATVPKSLRVASEPVVPPGVLATLPDDRPKSPIGRERDLGVGVDGDGASVEARQDAAADASLVTPTSDETTGDPGVDVSGDATAENTGEGERDVTTSSPASVRTERVSESPIVPHDAPSNGLTLADVAAAVFVDARPGFETSAYFEDVFLGREVLVEGEVSRREAFRSDLLFGNEGGVKLTLELALDAVDVSSFARSVRVVLAFAQDDARHATLDRGARVHATGTLVKCDPFLRVLFVRASD